MKYKTYKRTILGLIIATLLLAFGPAGFYVYRHTGIQPGQCYFYHDDKHTDLILQIDKVLNYGVMIHITHPTPNARTDSFYITFETLKYALTRCDCVPLR